MERKVTVVSTVQITQVFKNVPDCFEMDKNEAKKKLQKDLKTIVGADDVQVKEIQQFIMDK